jgi:hypothetical protein
VNALAFSRLKPVPQLPWRSRACRQAWNLPKGTGPGAPSYIANTFSEYQYSIIAVEGIFGGSYYSFYEFICLMNAKMYECGMLLV